MRVYFVFNLFFCQVRKRSVIPDSIDLRFHYIMIGMITLSLFGEVFICVCVMLGVGWGGGGV